MWLKIDDNFIAHPKVIRAANELGRHGLGRVLVVWHQGLSHASKFATDGFISHAVLDRFHDERDPRAVAMSLASAGLWDVCDDGYRIHDYLDYNLSASEVARKRAEDRARKSRGIQTDSIGIPPGIREDSDRIPSASRARDPDPSPSCTTKEKDTRFARFWAAYPKRRAKGDAERAFAALKPTDALLETMLAALVVQAASEDWRKEGGKFIPHPATWLRAKRWADEEPSRLPPSVEPEVMLYDCRCGECHLGTDPSVCSKDKGQVYRCRVCSGDHQGHDPLWCPAKEVNADVWWEQRFGKRATA